MLAGKKILLAVCGSIAAYKSAFLVRLLVKKGAKVQVIMTNSAKDFITPLTLSTLSKNPVHSDFFEEKSGQWQSHVELGLWADIMLIAPASANTLAKLANGLCDNLLSAVYLSARCPILIAPAMDLDMYQHPATKANIDRLLSFGNHLIDAEDGELASGLSGQGRMADPENILAYVEAFLAPERPLSGKKVVITSGPTHEAIDAVRFIGNHSSGKMGAALAEACRDAGAKVTFITGPVHALPPNNTISIQQVKSAGEMFEAAQKSFKDADVGIFAAAVSDYRPKESYSNKKKKDGHSFSIELIENPDIAAELGKNKRKNQITVGFALETDQEQQNAQKKLQNKNFDLIALNSLNDEGAGFAHETNKVTVFDRHNNHYDFELKSKKEVASDIVNLIAKELNA
ncbi:MAG: bifunctional phosphopantothenoylcysteine decarboxylase/phosphopantothenate--cysteine ligase CoaBC [Cyclobacteriaceae bacterium]|nr:bifunctional phosphopantothenoylcysteine decarboxylase/phosphopantothenate--cysteine ligase CoaBC [Cyclobacteriaceae bacterium HetDA_MAG_MS6]